MRVLCLSTLSFVLAVKDLHPSHELAISEENYTQLSDNNSTQVESAAYHNLNNYHIFNS